MDARPGATTTPRPRERFPYRAILCWVDSLEEPDVVVSVAQTLAALHHGRCLVVKVISLVPPNNEPQGYQARSPQTPAMICSAERRLVDLYGGNADTMVLLGHPVRAVRRFVQHHKMELVVMGEQAVMTERRYDERLVDQAPCAVMIVLPPRRSEPGRPPRPESSQTRFQDER